MFDDTLSKGKGTPINIKLRPGVKPYLARPYPNPNSQEKKIGSETERLIRARVLKKVSRSEWVAPNFMIPKIDETIRFITAFRELNQRIKTKPYHIPRIQDLLMKLEGFQWAPNLDLDKEIINMSLNMF